MLNNSCLLRNILLVCLVGRCTLLRRQSYLDSGDGISSLSADGGNRVKEV